MRDLLNLLPGLTAMFAGLMVRLDTVVRAGGNPSKLIRTMRVLIAQMTDIRVTVFQHETKNAMLSDPAWRARVIADLGGRAALYRWQEKSRAPIKDYSAHISVSRKTPSRPLVPSKRAFRLPPLVRGYMSRKAVADRDWRPYMPAPHISPFDRPITVSPEELLSRRAAQPDDALNGNGPAEIKGWRHPPASPDPP
ncbi:hypothetical protein [Fretibacter rubidus]|uniref:hypothetical protein n=1 Tax=Fretibacter rubidus TaxID=570162 RepID=UPI00352B0CF7